MNYSEDIKLTKGEKLLHSYKVLGEWKLARKQLHLGQIYNSEHVSIWEIICGESNTAVHVMSTKDLVLNLLKF